MTTTTGPVELRGDLFGNTTKRPGSPRAPIFFMHHDPSVPDGILEVRHPETGEVLGRIVIAVGKAKAKETT